MLSNIINKYIYLIIFILVAIFNYKILLNPMWYTFNFADNFWYAKLIELMKLSFQIWTPFYIPEWSVFVWEDYKVLMITPLWQTLGVIVSYIMPTILYINLVIVWSLYLNILFSYKLFEYINKSNPLLSLVWAVIFWASSLVLYAVWFNLMWLFFIPLIVLCFLKYIKTNKIRYLFGLILSFILLGLSSTYFLPLIWIILLPFFLKYIKKHFLKVITSALLLIVSFVGIFFVYKIPFTYLESYNKWIEVESLLEERAIKSSSLDLLELFTPNNNNLFTKFQLRSIKDLSTSDNRYFRYSNYLPIPILLLICLLVFWNKKIPWIWYKYNEYKKISLFIIGINNLLHYLKWLPNWEVIRKSAYFFFALTFGLSLLIISWFDQKYTSDNQIILLVFLLVIIVWNIWPYYWKVFAIHNINADVREIENNSVILPLPNSGYNNWEFQYNLMRHEKDFKIVEFWNATLPNFKRSIKNGSKTINKIAYNKRIEEKWYCDFWIDIDYILLYKKYIENFFFYSHESKIFKTAESNINKCENIELHKDASNTIIYKILY